MSYHIPPHADDKELQVIIIVMLKLYIIVSGLEGYSLPVNDKK